MNGAEEELGAAVGAFSPGRQDMDHSFVHCPPGVKVIRPPVESGFLCWLIAPTLCMGRAGTDLRTSHRQQQRQTGNPAGRERESVTMMSVQ